MQTSTQETALKHYQQILLRNPKDIDAQIHCGNLCIELGRYEEAAGYFRRLLRIFKTNQDVRDALCFALQALGNEAHTKHRFTMAEACFQEALQYQPKNAVYWYNLGNAQRELGRPKEALKSFQESAKVNPDDADTLNNLGNMYRELGQLDQAILSYKQALEINPDLHHALAHLVHQQQHICDWQDLEHNINNVRQIVKSIPSARISPFAFLSMPGTTAEEQKTCANHWVQNQFANLIALGEELNFKHQTSHGDKHQKIKIGYLSADFRLHPLAFLITELIELHDRTQFEVFAFSFGLDDKSSARIRLEKAFDAFHDIRFLTDIEAANKINACGIDILVDLTGFTQTSRSGIAALKPAPINVNWLGFPGTMGAVDQRSNANNPLLQQPLFDYIMTDDYITPPASAVHYAETLMPLPNCYQPNNHQRPIGKKPTRESCALSEGAFVFCCFNQTFKITPAIFAVWMRLLKARPNSELWLLECNVWAKQNLIIEAAKHGITSHRIIFAPRVSIADHLARHVYADLFLDTLPYNAHTTCSDALWMGVPVLTCSGNTFASRVAGSLLNACNLPELITDNLAAYEQKALELANDHAALASIKQKLSSNNSTVALFNTSLFTRNLENAFITMYNAKLK